MVATTHDTGTRDRRDGGPAAAPARRAGGRAGHHRANTGSWAAVVLIIIGFSVGVFALVTGLVVLWVLTGAALVAGGVTALASRIMDQAY